MEFLLTFSARPLPEARTARQEGGGGGNAEPSERNQTEASPATLLFKARHHRKILFSLLGLKLLTQRVSE